MGGFAQDATASRLRAIGKPLSAEHQRIGQLESENRQLRGDVEILKSVGLLCPRTQMSYVLIGDLHKKATPISHACRALGVSRSGYYSAAKASLAAPKVCYRQRTSESGVCRQWPHLRQPQVVDSRLAATGCVA